MPTAKKPQQRRSTAAKPRKPKAREDRGEFRGIYETMPDSPEFRALSGVARLCVLILKLKLGRAGIRVFYLESLPGLTGFSADQCAQAVHELVRDRWLIVWEPVVWLRNGLRFDPSDPLASEPGRKGIVSLLLALPKVPIINEFLIHYPELRDEWQKALAKTPRGPIAGGHEGAYEGAYDAPTGSQMTDDAKGIGMTERDDGKRDGSPTDPDAEPTPPSAASFRAGAQGAEGGTSSDPPDQIAGDGTACDQRQLMVSMANLVKAYTTETALDGAGRRSFHAKAEALIRGSDYTAWQDTTGTQAPWPDRPRLMELAIGRLKSGESTSLRSALRYVIPQQYDPFERTSSNRPAPGSEHEKVRTAGEELPQDTATKRNGRLTRTDGSDPEKAEREAEKRDLEELAMWEREHPDEAATLRTEIEFELQEDPKWKNAESVARKIMGAGLYRKRIREKLERSSKPELVA